MSTSVRVCRFGLKSDKLRLHCVFSFWLVYATDLAVAGCCRPAPEREREREREREKMCVCVCVRESESERESTKQQQQNTCIRPYTSVCERVKKKKKCIRALYTICVCVCV